MTWQPPLPLTLAERHVDFPAHETHIYERRQQVENACVPLVKRIGYAVVHDNGLAPQPLVRQLADRLATSLDATAVFGYRQARREIASLRNEHGWPPLVVTGEYALPDAGRFLMLARGGLEAIRRFLHQRADQTSRVLASTAHQAYASGSLAFGELLLVQQVVDKTRRALHNNVLELVGETLNMGRTAGALSMPQPPEYALRSEQLDKRMCSACGSLHGTIDQVGSGDFFNDSPPAGCLGGGRCRGIWVYGDSTGQLEAA